MGAPISTFTSTFDGNGHTLANLYVNVSSDGPAYAGLFGRASGTIKNVGLTGEHMYVRASSSPSPPYNPGSYAYATYAGGLVGYVYAATITNCYATGEVSASSSPLLLVLCWRLGGVCQF